MRQRPAEIGLFETPRIVFCAAAEGHISEESKALGGPPCRARPGSVHRVVKAG